MEIDHQAIMPILKVAEAEPNSWKIGFERTVIGAYSLVREGLISFPAISCALSAHVIAETGRVGTIYGQAVAVPGWEKYIFATASVGFLGAMLYDVAQVGKSWHIMEKLQARLPFLQGKNAVDTQ